MPAKKTAPKKRARRETVAENNVRLRARLGQLLSDHFKDVDRIAELELLLAEDGPEVTPAGRKVMAENLRDRAAMEKDLKLAHAMLVRLYEHQERHDPDPLCPTCTGVEAYLEGRTLTEDQQREFEQL